MRLYGAIIIPLALVYRATGGKGQRPKIDLLGRLNLSVNDYDANSGDGNVHPHFVDEVKKNRCVRSDLAPSPEPVRLRRLIDAQF